MKKILLSMALFALINVSNAMRVANGVELVSSRSWITGNLISGHMEEDKVFFSYASAYAAAHGGTGKVSTNITSSGNHSFRIENTSKSVQAYTVLIQLCADVSNCFKNSKDYRLNPGANYSSSAETYITSYYSSVGCRSLVADTVVSGSVSASDRGSASVCATR